jgi:hypothetical protein
MGMTITGFPTSSDIYLEVDGTRVAVVQSYSARTTRSSTAVEAFGESEPVATIPGRAKHTVELTRLYATDEAIRDGIDFYALSGFSLVVCKPDRKVIYADCQWSTIKESAELGAMVLEQVTLVASRRIETEA